MHILVCIFLAFYFTECISSAFEIAGEDCPVLSLTDTLLFLLCCIVPMKRIAKAYKLSLIHISEPTRPG